MKNPKLFVPGLLMMLLSFISNVKAETEPNNSFEQANVIDLNSKYTGYLDNSDGKDWYKMHITKDGRLAILDSTSSTLGYILRLYEEDGTTIIQETRRWENNAGGTLAISLSPGYYYVEFERYSSNSPNPYGEYAFTLHFMEVSRPGDAEPNDAMMVSQMVALNTSVSANLGHRKTGMVDNIDWYKFTVPDDGRLTLLDTTVSTLGYILRLFEKDGTTLIQTIRRWENNAGGTLSISLLSGQYLVEFERYSSNSPNPYGEYTFTLHFMEVSRPGDAEPNDSLQHAVVVRFDSLYTGNLGHRKTGMYDNSDWYKFTMPEDGRVTLLDTTVSTLGYIMQLFKNDGTTLLQTIRRWEDNSGGTLSINLSQGTYYILITKYGFDYSTYGTYYFYLNFMPKPDANFTFVQHISSVSFTNKTVNGDSYQWNFDDGKTSTEVNPGHDFNEPGEYNVTLIAYNLAGSDTVSHYITVYGVQKIVNNVGGNTGDVSIDIYGGGFTKESAVKFRRAGFEDIIPDTILNTRKGVMSARFNLRGAATGEWDVEIENPGATTIVEKGGFTIIEGNEPEPWVEISGRDRALIGRWQTYTLNYGNKGNVDAAGVPIWLVVSENQDTEIQFVDFKVVPPPYAVNTLQFEDKLRDSVSIFFVTDTLFGEPLKCRVYPLIIPVIPAGQTGQLTIKVKSMQNFQLMAWVNPPMFESPMNQEVQDCIFWAQMKAVAEGIITVAGSALPIGCLHAVTTNYIYNPWNYDKPTDDDPKSIGSHMWTLASTIINCAGDLPVFKVYKLTVAILQFAASVTDNYIADQTCRNAFENKSKTNMNVRAVTSLDPNEKAGPGGIADNNYIRKLPLIDYTIYFENKDTAKAPAQEIKIIDSLDTNVFDIRESNFKSFTIADTTINVLAGLKEFTVDLDMRPEMDMVTRATGNIDTVSSIISWFFKALNPETMDDNENPDLGVLLPNIISPKGEGNVTFNVGLKPEKGNNDIIKNKAVITFDYNAAIETNEYFNTIDSEKPQSSILPLASQSSDEINLEIQGSDNGSGIEYYTVFASVNDSDYVPVVITSTSQAKFIPDKGTNFKLYSVATDKLGNTEDAPLSADTETDLVSINNIQRNDHAIKVWPNPVRNALNIFCHGYDGEEIRIELKTMLGQSIRTERLNPDHGAYFKLDLSVFMPGIYLLNIKCGKTDYYEKIMKY